MDGSGEAYEGKVALDNRDIARVLHRVADLLEFTDDNPFKIRSYRMAAETVEALQDSVAETVARGGASALQKIPGIGKSISGQITEIVNTGSSAYLETLRQQTPESAVELRRVTGIGLKTAQTLYRDFGIKSLKELQVFADGGGLKSVPGLGEKTASRIVASIARLESERAQMRMNDAIQFAESLAHELKTKAIAHANARGAAASEPRIEIVGQIRRGVDVVTAVELLAAGEPDALRQALRTSAQIGAIKRETEDSIEAESKAGVLTVLHLADPSDLAVALVRTTGSHEHLRDLEAAAKEAGLLLERFRLQRAGRSPVKRGKGSTAKATTSAQEGAVDLTTEQDLYRALGLDFIPPELREGQGEIEAARAGHLPKLIEAGDIRGDLHMHTTWTDGQHSVREMIQAAQLLGYEYVAITDHTRSTTIARGNTPEELLQEIDEIDAIAKEFEGIRVLKGAEVDILGDGSLDMPADVLDRLDWIVCSIHSGLQQSRQEITRRVVRAIETSYPNALGHPTGRIIGRRPAYDIDLDEVFAAARRCNVRMELNASPHRLDLDSRWLAAAKRAGVGIVISTDAHKKSALASMRYGVSTARRGGLTASDVLNTRPLPGLLEELERKRSSRSTK